MRIFLRVISQPREHNVRLKLQIVREVYGKKPVEGVREPINPKRRLEEVIKGVLIILFLYWIAELENPLLSLSVFAILVLQIKGELVRLALTKTGQFNLRILVHAAAPNYPLSLRFNFSQEGRQDKRVS